MNKEQLDHLKKFSFLSLVIDLFITMMIFIFTLELNSCNPGNFVSKDALQTKADCDPTVVCCNFPPALEPDPTPTKPGVDAVGLLEGTVKTSNCSASLVIFRNQPTSSKAWLLTNGHCVNGSNLLKDKEVWVNRSLASDQEMTLWMKGQKPYKIYANKVIYATMTGTDLGIYGLTTTYDDIKDKSGVVPYILDDAHPAAGTEIAIPSGYRERTYSCKIGKFVNDVFEDVWHWKDSIKYTSPGCEIIGGTSGSPVINVKDGEVIGVNNTINENGSTCTRNNPCEKDAQGNVISNKKGDGYGQQTYIIYSCLKDDFSLDLNKAGCMLAKP